MDTWFPSFPIQPCLLTPSLFWMGTPRNTAVKLPTNPQFCTHPQSRSKQPFSLYFSKSKACLFCIAFPFLWPLHPPSFLESFNFVHSCLPSRKTTPPLSFHIFPSWRNPLERLLHFSCFWGISQAPFGHTMGSEALEHLSVFFQPLHSWFLAVQIQRCWFPSPASAQASLFFPPASQWELEPLSYLLILFSEGFPCLLIVSYLKLVQFPP